MKNTFKKPIIKILLLSTLTAFAIIACKKIEDPATVNQSTHSSNPKALNTQGLPLDNQHVITNDEANYIINRFKTNYPLLRSTSYYSSTAIKNVLDQQGLARVKFYYGSTILGQPELFMLGMDANNNDMVNGTLISSAFAGLLGNDIVTQLLSWTDTQLINLTNAASATARHRNIHANLNFGNSFTQDAIRALVIDSTAAGVRVDIGLNDNNQWSLVLRAVDNNGNLFVNALIVDNGATCPPNCANNNVLNSQN